MFRLLAILPLALALCGSSQAAISLSFNPGFPSLAPAYLHGAASTIHIMATSDLPAEDISLGNATLTLTGDPGFTFGATGTQSALIALTPTAGIGPGPISVATFTVNVAPTVAYNTLANITGTFTSVDLTLPAASGGAIGPAGGQDVIAIPEPSSLALLAFCGAGVVARRRRR